MKKWFSIICILISSYLSAAPNVLAFSGSTREDSFNKKLVLEAAQFAGEKGAHVKILNLQDLNIPFYDGDLEKRQGMPEGVRKLREWMLNSDIILIASPEYNGSVSGVLKNALDWASRNENQQFACDAFLGKTFVIMSASPGKGGGARGLMHLKAILESVKGTVLQEQISVPQAYSAFNAAGRIKDPKKRSELKRVIDKSLQ